MGVTPILELWGAGVLNQLSDTMAIAIASGHSRASVLLVSTICTEEEIVLIVYA